MTEMAGSFSATVRYLLFTLLYTIQHSLTIVGFWIEWIAMSMPRGALIVVEGLDRAGKSSQCECLRDSLQQFCDSVKYIRFPGRIRFSV